MTDNKYLQYKAWREHSESGRATYGQLNPSGTELCISLDCKCGAELHADGHMEGIICSHCGRVYVLSRFIEAYQVPDDIRKVALEHLTIVDGVDDDRLTVAYNARKE